MDDIVAQVSDNGLVTVSENVVAPVSADIVRVSVKQKVGRPRKFG